MVPFDPFQQTAGLMQSQPDGRMPLQLFHERQIGVLIDLLEDRLEIADRLMPMNEKHEMEGSHR
jgi:hypothetical protein